MVGLFVLLFSSIWEAKASFVTGSIKAIGDSTHIEFVGLSEWEYSVDRVAPDVVELIIPAVSDSSLVEFIQWQKANIRHIKVDKKEANNSYKLTFMLSGADVESFDYLTDQPSRLILDFYKKKNKPVDLKAIKKEKPKGKITKTTKLKKMAPQGGRPSADVKEALKLGYSKFKRKPASSELLKVVRPKGKGIEKRDQVTTSNSDVAHGVFDGGDPNFNRFRIRDYEVNEDAVIASRQNIYIRFPMVNIEFNRLAELEKAQPIYRVAKTDSKENKEIRFLLNLFKKNRYGSFAKVYKYFVKRYPHSQYIELARYLNADMNYKLYKRDGRKVDLQLAISMYEKNLLDYPNSPLAERKELELAYMALDRKNAAEAIQKFMKYAKLHKGTQEADRARMALAQGYRQLRKTELAKTVYNELLQEAVNPENRREARYRIGDTYFDDKKMEMAIAAYETAIMEYPKSDGIYPNAYYNLGEAYFWTGKHQKSLENHIKFLTKFPDHPQGGFALTRIGELLDILGADKSKVMGAYLESYFRYRSSQGAEIARVRMLSQRLHSMKEVEVKNSIAEMKEFAKNSSLAKMGEFVTLMIADGLHGRKEHHRALEYLIPYFQRNPTSNNLAFFKKRILRNISDVINQNLEKEDFMAALKFYGQHSNTWLRNTDRIDIPFEVARAYELAGVRKESEKIYKKVLARLKKIEGTEEQKERRVNEHLPTINSVLLRLASVSNESREFHRSGKYLNQIKSLKELSDKERVERVAISSKVFEAQGKIEKAVQSLNKLAKDWEGEPKLLVPVYYRLASLFKKQRKYGKAEVAIGYLEELYNENPNLERHIRAKSLRLKGDIFLSEGRGVAAVQAYLTLLKEFESEQELSSVRYKAGLVMFDRGDIKGAEKIWSGLDSSKGKVYKKLASEKLGNASWKSEYKKYIDRIPAAAGL